MIQCTEQMGMIEKIDQWVLVEACRFIIKINRELDQSYQMAVNISALEVMKVDFVDEMLKIIQESGVEPSFIRLEMTEGILIDSYDTGAEAFRALQETGVTLALDDFGTGYSSLKYLSELPLDILKIDRSFVDHMASNEQDYELFKAIIEISHKKGIAGVAEGVETREQMHKVVEVNCGYIQGYYLSRPLREEKIRALINLTFDPSDEG